MDETATKVELSEARGTDSEDAAAFAHFAEQAAGGMWRMIFGAGAPQVLMRVYAQPGHDLSYEEVVFARAGERRLGMLSGFSGARHEARASRTNSVLLRSAGWRLPRAGLMATLAWPLLGFMERVPPADWYVQMVAVRAEARGQGIGSRLMRSAEARAHQSDCTRMALDVDVANQGGIRLYERLGYTCEARSRRALLLGGAQVQRMVRALREPGPPCAAEGVPE